MKRLILVLLLIASALQASEYSPMPEPVLIGKQPKAEVPFDIEKLKFLWEKRILAIKDSGVLPIIDVESSFKAGKLNALEYAQQMDTHGIALTAFSPQVGEKNFNKTGRLWHDGARRALHIDPARYIPVSTAGIHPAFTKKPLDFVLETISRVKKENYPMMGEFEFRHYMSPRQYKKGETQRDVHIPIDSDAGHALFKFSHESGICFQIHYEIEDILLPPLQKMLSTYPKAKVIWCHLGQVRYSDKAKTYGPDMLKKMIRNHKGLYFDLAFGDPHSIYPGSGEYQAKVWSNTGCGVKQEWVDLIEAYPYRFLAALDIGGDRMDQVGKRTQNLRKFISCLSPETQTIVACKAAWKLILKEDLCLNLKM